MAALPASNPTLMDLATRTAPDGSIDTMIVEILQQTEEILDDMVWVPGNLETGHKTTIRTGIPEPTWRRLNYGVPQTKSTTAQVIDTCGMLEDYGQVDKALAELNGNSAAFRLTEDKAHIQGFSHKLARTIFYGSEGSDPAGFTGFAPRFNALSGVESAQNVISAGGAGSDNASIWLVVWGDDRCHGIVPKHSMTGLQHRDLGEDRVADAAGNYYQALISHYRWDAGLTVRDWRYIVRICNIDVSNLTKDAASGADLVDYMTQALELVQSLSGGRPAFYMNRRLRSVLRRQIKNAKNMNLSLDTVAGRQVLNFDGVPVRMSDSLLLTEAAVT
jgi:hypothetical protein